MQVFFESPEQIESFLRGVRTERCPACGRVGAFRRHGYGRGWLTPKAYGIRRWRICCRREYGGCGKTPSVCLASLVRDCWFTAKELWIFLRALPSGRSVLQAWDSTGSALSVEAGYRILKRLRCCQSVLRTCLHGRAPPEKKKSAGDPLLQTVEHLRQIFGNSKGTVASYQLTLQRDILAVK